jgi:hypothetical protein
MDCRLQVFKRGEMDNSLTKTYRFAVLDLNKAKDYPANFVCMLPLKVDQRNGKTLNVFGELFGDKSVDFAIGLLNDALKNESDVEVKTELERRLKLIDPKKVNLIKCSQCKKVFQPRKIRKYKQNFCDDCLKARYGQRHYW